MKNKKMEKMVKLTEKPDSSNLRKFDENLRQESLHLENLKRTASERIHSIGISRLRECVP
jgi:hypothetical protein